MYQDKTLTCRGCGRTFVFTAGEQEFYSRRGFTNEPGRCSECRRQRKQQGDDSVVSSMRTGSGGGSRALFDAVCSSCGSQTQVPFQPVPGRPVYCRNCYESRRRV